MCEGNWRFYLRISTPQKIQLQYHCSALTVWPFIFPKFCQNPCSFEQKTTKGFYPTITVWVFLYHLGVGIQWLVFQLKRSWPKKFLFYICIPLEKHSCVTSNVSQTQRHWATMRKRKQGPVPHGHRQNTKEKYLGLLSCCRYILQTELGNTGEFNKILLKSLLIWEWKTLLCGL